MSLIEAAAHLKSGLTDKARTTCIKYCNNHPNDPSGWSMLAHIYRSIGDYSSALSTCKKIVGLFPASADAHFNLALALSLSNNIDESIAEYHTAIRYSPDDPEIRIHLADMLMNANRHREALEQYIFASGIYHNSSALYHKVAEALTLLNKQDEAEKYLKKALAVEPDNAFTWFKLANIYEALNKPDKSIECYKNSLKFKPENEPVCTHLGYILVAQGRADESLEYFNKAVQIAPGAINARAGIAEAYEKLGDYEQACNKLTPLLPFAPEYLSIAFNYGNLCKYMSSCNDAINILEGHMNRNDLTPDQNRSICFQLGKLYETQDNIEKSFKYYKLGNDNKNISFDTRLHQNNIDSIINSFTAETIKALPKSRKYSKQLRPVFIVGMPRSGTTLTEQILSSHPDVFGAGELTDVHNIVCELPSTLQSTSEYPLCASDLTQDVVNTLSHKYLKRVRKLSGNTSKLIIDKMPNNFLYLGLIELLFPNALIINCTRNMYDTCLSCYSIDFGAEVPFVYDLHDLGAYYFQYERLMSHWKATLSLPVLDVQYEAFITNTKPSVETLLEFCGLKWNSKCLDFHKNKRVIKTASYNQVNKPIYNSSVGRWKKYDAYFDELREGYSAGF